MAKGQQVVEQQLGVKLDSAPAHVLRQAEIEHEEYLLDAAIKQKELDIEAEKAGQAQVTERWKADMLSDSWLSKNIRPLVLLYLLGAYTVFSLSSGVGFQVTQAYVELLAQMLMLVMSAYFVGRSIEKVIDMKERGK
jgi:hypothetical protein